MVPLRKEKGILAATVAILSSAVLAPTASARDQVRDTAEPEIAGAHDGCLGGRNCYAVGYTDGFIVDGAAARFDVREYTAPDWDHALPSAGFTAQVLWIGVENDTAKDEWCEIGWTKSFQNSGAYNHYLAWQVDGDYQEFPIYYAIEMGRSYHYQIVREYDGKYNLYIDLDDVGDCHANPFTLWAQVGLEYTHPGALAATNDPRELQWRRATDLVWFNWGDLGTAEGVEDAEIGSASRWNWEVFPTHGENWTTN